MLVNVMSMQYYNPANMLKIATVIAKRGRYGMLVVRPCQFPLSKYLELKHVFVQQNAVQYLPYFVLQWQILADCLQLSLEEIRSPELASKLIGKQLYVNSPQLPENSEFPPNYQGYSIVTQNRDLGAIQAIWHLPQATAQLFIDNREILIPLHPDHIHSINHAQKILYMQIPEGLLEIYLQ